MTTAESKYSTEEMNHLLSSVYAELKDLAHRFMSTERVEHTLQPTALLHEALLRLQKSTGRFPSDDKQFCMSAAAVMRHVLIDHARRKRAAKRGGQMIRLEMDQHSLPAADVPIVDLLDLDQALDQLADLNSRHAHVAQMRLFAGMTIDETAALLGVSSGTVKNDWRMARAWLLTRLDGFEAR